MEAPPVTRPAQRAPRYAPDMDAAPDAEDALAVAVAEQHQMNDLLDQWGTRKDSRDQLIWVAANRDGRTRQELERAFAGVLSWSSIRGILKEQAAFARGRATTDNGSNK